MGEVPQPARAEVGGSPTTTQFSDGLIRHAEFPPISASTFTPNR